MLLSYLKIAWKVLLRRKFFTFISLFGISFTLMILLVVYAMYDHTVGPHTPEKKVDRLLFITKMGLWAETSQSNSNVSYSFLERYVRPMRTPQLISVSSNEGSVVAYPGNQKLKLDQRYTDGQFWQVLDFDFVEGRPYTIREVKEAAHVVVINENTARRYFGASRGVVGRRLEADQIVYQVVGVVRDVPATRYISYADVWMPITTSTEDIHDPSYLGNCHAILLAPTPAAVPTVEAEFNRIVAQVPVPKTGDGKHSYQEVRVHAGSLLSTLVREEFDEDGPDDGVAKLARTSAGLALLFMLLPALSLINVNVSRIMERSSEIGVRKAFGATPQMLVKQFLVENIFLTLLGGILGLSLAAGALYLLNDSSLIAYTTFRLNWRIFLAAFLTIGFFGLLSGVYPAYKMSKLRAVQALKGGTNV
ncbi:ABC transporter permease [Hymenobacter tibetensis]|uniref:ABC transporter permease n=1 Tax=Hymenobacter tibetensis TaxID=497967 RepID=A0ABY4D2N8_9BACT|nr:ABC transporter permease [Hymenobacter tibetensis]UOG76806.1 ABC transporter permease [Hymenobacter tibetensis]